MFQYKTLRNILHANKMLFKFGKVTPPLYPICKLLLFHTRVPSSDFGT